MNQFIKRFEDWRQGRAITPALLCAYRDNLGLAPMLSNTSRNRHMAEVKPFVNELRLRKALTFVKADIYDAMRPWPVESHEPKVLDAAQIKQLVGAAVTADPRIAAFVLLGLTTGSRCAEVASIRPECWRRDHIVVTDSKRARDKRVPLKWSTTLQAMAGWPMWPMWTAKKVPPTPNWRKLLVAAGLGIDFEPRILRRTAASFAASSGKVPAVWLSEWFGHTNQIADRFYRLAQSEVAGETIEQWYGCEAEFTALLNAVTTYGLQRA